MSLSLLACQPGSSDKSDTTSSTQQQYQKHHIRFSYPVDWRIGLDMKSAWGTQQISLASAGDTLLHINLQPTTHSDNLRNLARLYNARYGIPVLTDPQPKPKWSEVQRNGLQGLQEINDVTSATIAAYVKEFYRIPLDQQTALIVIESNREEIERYDDAINLLLGTIKPIQ